MPHFSAAKRRLMGGAIDAGAGEGRCSGGFGGEVSGSSFAASVFDIWAMPEDGPPKMSSAKDDFAIRNEVT